jgi:hypothetical protein
MLLDPGISLDCTEKIVEDKHSSLSQTLLDPLDCTEKIVEDKHSSLFEWKRVILEPESFRLCHRWLCQPQRRL